MSTDFTADRAGNKGDQDYRILLDAIPDLMLRLNREGMCVDYQIPRSFRAYCSGIDWRGKFIWEIMPPEMVEQRMQAVDHAIATHQIQIYEQQIEIEGRLQHEEVRVIRCNTQEALVIVRDISDRKYAEAALQRSESRFHKMTANVPGMLYQFQLTPDGTATFPYASAFAEQIWEIPPEQFQNDASVAIAQVHPEDRSQFASSVQQSAETLEPWEWIGRLVPASGKVKWVQAHSRPELQTDGSIIWDGLLMDISDRVQMEAERQQAELAIAESEARFRSFVENANDLIFACATTGEFTYLSPRIAEMTGFSVENLLGKSFVEFIHPDDLDRVCAVIEKLLTTGERQTALEFRGKCKDGSWFWALCNSAPIQTAKGEIVSLLGIARDISELKANEAILIQQEIELETALDDLKKAQAQLIQSEKMSALGQLVAGIAHEINNPIGFIHGNVSHAEAYFKDFNALIQLYQKHYAQPHPEIAAFLNEIEFEFVQQDLPKLFQSIQTGTDRVREIVLSLRNFSRLDEAKLKPVNLHDGIESTLTILQNRLRNIEIHKRYGQVPEIECFASALNQVFLQLLTNAIEALEFVSAPKIEVQTTLMNSDWVRIRLVDNGSGISQAVQARMFDPFFTTKPIGKGTGMGLAISYQIVTEQHHGKLNCRSQSNQGTEFTIELPIRQPQVI